MKIVFTGGETGGHFYPLIAIAESIRDIVREQHLIAPQLYFIAPSEFDKEALFENSIRFIPCPAGKWRRYFSLQNYLDLFVSFSGLISAFITLLTLVPDVVVSKGGYGSVPVTMAAKLIGIPVIIHESDAKPGRANLMASKYAARIAISLESSAKYFPKNVQDKIARTGIPIRSAIAHPEKEGSVEKFGLDISVPTILILGGSLGAERVNDVVVESLAELTSIANVIHQTGPKNFAGVERLAKLMLEKGGDLGRYHPFPYLTALSLRLAAGAADLVISRAGMTAIAEISLWHKPAILIPIPEAVSHDQRENAYAYAKTGAASVLEEGNLTSNLLASEAKRILGDANVAAQMAAASANFGTENAGRVIAEEVIRIALSHQ
jgi:UDP-N-acetylglucosamine--N-acetylmuramyl-(pentapeptide) pyrophosphoryl-undecaprenol N-acetylglucosamine transferase